MRDIMMGFLYWNVGLIECRMKAYYCSNTKYCATLSVGALPTDTKMCHLDPKILKKTTNS